MKRILILGAWLSSVMVFSSCATLKKNNHSSDDYTRTERQWSNNSVDRQNWLDRDSTEHEEIADARRNSRRFGEGRDTRRDWRAYEGEGNGDRDRRTNDRSYSLPSDENSTSFDDRRRNSNSRFDEEGESRDRRFRSGDESQDRRSRSRDDEFFNQRYEESDRSSRYQEYDRSNSNRRNRFQEYDEEDQYERRRDRNRSNRSNRGEEERYSSRRDEGVDRDIIRLEAIVGYELDNLDAKINNFRTIQNEGKRRKRKFAKEEVAILEEHRGELFKLYRKVNTASSSNFSLIRDQVEKRLAMIREYVPNPELYLR